MNDNPYSPQESRNDVSANSRNWSLWRLVPAGILIFIGLQVLLAITMSLIDIAFSPMKRGPQAPPIYITIFVIGRMICFGAALVYAGIAILRGRDELAAFAIVTGVATLWLSLMLL